MHRSINQLSLFELKGDFDTQDFEKPVNLLSFNDLIKAIHIGFQRFKEDDRNCYGPTTKANMLNCQIWDSIKVGCINANFKVFDTMDKVRRHYAILNSKYVILLKKDPVSNIRTKNDDKIKFQELEQHVVTLTYTIDKYWSHVKSVDFRYYSSPNCVTYTFSLNNLEVIKEVPFTKREDNILPKVKLKENLKRKSS